MATKHDVDAAVSMAQGVVLETFGRFANVSKMLESMPVTKDGYVVSGGDAVYHVEGAKVEWYVVAYVPKPAAAGNPPVGGWVAIGVQADGGIAWSREADVRECYSLHDNAQSEIDGTLAHKWGYGEGLRAPSVRTDGDGWPLMYEIHPFFNGRGGISYCLSGTDEALLGERRYETFDTIPQAQARCEKAEAEQILRR